jgi:hypothetical protein
MKDKEILDIEALYERYHIYSTYQRNIFPGLIFRWPGVQGKHTCTPCCYGTHAWLLLTFYAKIVVALLFFSGKVNDALLL